MPANDGHPSHVTANLVAAEEPFASALGGWVRRSPVLPAARYALLLHELGLREAVVRLEVYTHELGSREDVVEWVRGAFLTAFEARLPAALWPEFLDRYRERLREVLPDRRPFPYTYERLFLAATR
jgi:trans-aconitate 2-methyltransferase